MRRLDEGVDALLRLQTGVGGPPADLDVVHPDALAPDLQRPAVGGRLEHEHLATRHRPLLDELPRRQRADLLVAGEQQLDATTVGERGHGVDGGDDAPFMSNTPGPVAARLEP